jgi:hypothetical protein
MIKASKRDNWKSLDYLDNGKENSLMLHSLKRIRERLGLRLTKSDYSHIVSVIKNNKISEKFQYEYKGKQSNRLDIYELIFLNKVPVDILFDKDRNSIVTVLYQREGDIQEISYFYDVFNNKIQLKHTYGYNQGWKIDGTKLMIPSETTHWNGEHWEVTSEGQLEGKRFKLDNEHLIEVM